MITGIGLIGVLAPNPPKPGRLPSYIVMERGNRRFFFLTVSRIQICVVQGLVAWLLRAVTR